MKPHYIGEKNANYLKADTMGGCPGESIDQKYARENINWDAVHHIDMEYRQKKALDCFVLGMIAALENTEEAFNLPGFESVLEKLVENGFIKKEEGIYKLNKPIAKLIEIAGL